MLAYRIIEWQHPPELVEIPVPAVPAGTVLVKVAGTGLCHSDLGMTQMPKEIGEALGWQVPFTLGHEIGGWIAEVGDGVRGLVVDQPVVVVSGNSCGTCPFCRRGQENCCEQALLGRGYGTDGGLAEYVLVRDARHVVALAGLDPRMAGPLTDAGATSYHAVKRILPRLEVAGGDGVAVVVGAGGLGSYAIQFLRALSAAMVVAVDNNPKRVDAARRMGAHKTLMGVVETSAADLPALVGASLVDAVLDFVGVDDTIRSGLAWLRPGGAFGLVGAAGGTLRRPWYHSLPKDGEVFTFQGSTLADLRAVVGLAGEGRIVTEVDTFPLAKVAEAYDCLHHGTLAGRAVVVPTPGA